MEHEQVEQPQLAAGSMLYSILMISYRSEKEEV